MDIQRKRVGEHFIVGKNITVQQHSVKLTRKEVGGQRVIRSRIKIENLHARGTLIFFSKSCQVKDGLPTSPSQKTPKTIIIEKIRRISLLEAIQASNIRKRIRTSDLDTLFSNKTSQICCHGCYSRTNIRITHTESNKDNIQVQRYRKERMYPGGWKIGGCRR